MDEPVYVTGELFPPNEEFNAYMIVDPGIWSESMPLVDIREDGPTTLSSDGDGVIPPTLLSTQPLFPGEYNIVVDVDGDGLLDLTRDRIDRLGIGFYVIADRHLFIDSTEGGEVTTPGEGRFGCVAGMVVDLAATPDANYEFVEWTGDVGTVANVKAAATTITMNSDYSITAEFARKGCFISTAAYGTAMAEEVWVLREFRDGYLMTNAPGQAFVRLYCKVSPPIAGFIAEHPSLKPVVRVGLMPAVAMAQVLQ